MKLIAQYRMPREKHETHARIMSLYQDGLSFKMMGGRYGYHTITCDSRDIANRAVETRVMAHWAGYISATRGRATKPAKPLFNTY